jgi:preprotein translocase subunit YajC|uniref:preprotein translocase subunit YajC n=1 Tax=Sphingomonas sp. TaxID=28214 RepID=UPI0025CBAD59|nr:preprotein translocase subunit YajC [Sphingomonas sp.]
MLIPQAFAQTASGAAANGGAFGMVASIAPLLLVFVVFYFLMIRPQQKRVKAQQMTIEAVKKGDSVVTAGGIMGKVTKVEERIVEIEIAPTVKIKVVKATLSDVTGAGTAKPAND